MQRLIARHLIIHGVVKELKLEIALFFLYQVLTGVIFLVCFPFLLVFILVSGRHRRGLSERLGFLSSSGIGGKTAKRIWIHAASIGEVNAAATVIQQLKELSPHLSFVVTTMTLHGRDYAREKVGEDIPCFLAPLDVPFVVDRFMHLVMPDAYVCLETELWPLVIGKARRSGAAVILLNGRISDRSIDRYLRFRVIFSRVLENFDEIGVIGSIDAQRFILLGAQPENITITGNNKYDVQLPEKHLEIREKLRNLLGVDESIDVFIAGSTHDPEEEELLPVYQRLAKHYNQLWLIAPRHVDRMENIENMLVSHRVGYDLFSRCKKGEPRRHSLVLVDTFGDLAELYSIASFVFIGGSFSDCGGHNLMEAAVWGNVLLFGPFMDDFQEAADVIVEEGGGICVSSPRELEEQLVRFSTDRGLLASASTRAKAAAGKQRQAALRQAKLVVRHL